MNRVADRQDLFDDAADYAAFERASAADGPAAMQPG
jgi:hypothetical protein